MLVARLAPRQAALASRLRAPTHAIAVPARSPPRASSMSTLCWPPAVAPGIPGERVVQAPTLNLANEGRGRGRRRLCYPQRRMGFRSERGGEAGIQLEVNEANRQLVIDLCRRLNGMPVGVELAAVSSGRSGWTSWSRGSATASRLLTGGSRAALPRQQTLKATIDGSHDLLTAPEAPALRRWRCSPPTSGSIPPKRSQPARIYPNGRCSNFWPGQR